MLEGYCRIVVLLEIEERSILGNLLNFFWIIGISIIEFYFLDLCGSSELFGFLFGFWVFREFNWMYGIFGICLGFLVFFLILGIFCIFLVGFLGFLEFTK